MADPSTIVAKQQAVVTEAEAVGNVPTVVAKAQTALAEAQALASPPPTIVESPLNAASPRWKKQYDAQLREWVWNPVTGRITRAGVLLPWTKNAGIKYYQHSNGIRYTALKSDASKWYRINPDDTLVDLGTNEPGGAVPIPPPELDAGELSVFVPQRDAAGNVTNRGSMTLNKWYEIDDTKMNVKVAPPAGAPRGGLGAVLNNWGSGVQDRTKKQIHLKGGGHGDECNGWYTFDAAKDLWETLIAHLPLGTAEKQYLIWDHANRHPDHPPGALVPIAWAPGQSWGMWPNWNELPLPGSVDMSTTPPTAQPSGHDCEFHCWDKITGVDWLPGGFRIFCPRKTWYMINTTTKAMENLCKAVWQPGGTISDTNWQAFKADPVTRKIYGATSWGGDAKFREYDPSVPHTEPWQAWIDRSAGMFYSFGPNDCSAIVGREFVHYGWSGTIQAFHMDAKTWRKVILSQKPTVAIGGEFSMIESPDPAIAILTQNNGVLWDVNLQTGQVLLHPTVGRIEYGTIGANGLYGKLQYVEFEDAKLAVAIPNAGANVRVMRLA